MARRDEYTISPASTLDQRPTRGPEAGRRYDFLLAIIPVAFALAIGLGTAFGLPVRHAVLGASVVGIAALLDGLFFNPPGNALGG